MQASPADDRFELRATGPEVVLESLSDAVKAGLTAASKSLPCRFFYDADGSVLFEEICAVPEYYLTRAERCILEQRARDIAHSFDTPPCLVELGSGSAEKTELLIDALCDRNGNLTYIPIDISRSALEDCANRLLESRPQLEVEAVASEYEAGLDQIHSWHEQPMLVAWLGSSIGNLSRSDASAFLGRVRERLAPADRLLLGADLRKDRETLERAYDDSRGVTARFNLNLLTRINRELGGEFDAGTFRHRAIYDEAAGRVSMYLESSADQVVRIEKLDLDIEFAAGERIHTEDSVKYSFEELDALAATAGLRQEQRWLDPDERFSVSLLAPDLDARD